VLQVPFLDTEDMILMLLLLHPQIAGKFEELQVHEYIKHASYYSDVQETLLISDVLIPVTEPPIFLYIPDYTQYALHDKELYVKYRRFTFSIRSNNR
jgi:hypothetical protein